MSLLRVASFLAFAFINLAAFVLHVLIGGGELLPTARVSIGILVAGLVFSLGYLTIAILGQRVTRIAWLRILTGLLLSSVVLLFFYLTRLIEKLDLWIYVVPVFILTIALFVLYVWPARGSDRNGASISELGGNDG